MHCIIVNAVVSEAAEFVYGSHIIERQCIHTTRVVNETKILCKVNVLTPKNAYKKRYGI